MLVSFIIWHRPCLGSVRIYRFMSMAETLAFLLSHSFFETLAYLLHISFFLFNGSWVVKMLGLRTKWTSFSGTTKELCLAHQMKATRPLLTTFILKKVHLFFHLDILFNSCVASYAHDPSLNKQPKLKSLSWWTNLSNSVQVGHQNSYSPCAIRRAHNGNNSSRRDLRENKS